MKWLSQLATWGCTIVVARLLTPGDYGLVGMASVFLGLVTVLSEFGIGAAVVSLRSLSREQVRQLNTFALLFGVTSFAVSCLAAAPLSRFFGAPGLVGVVIVMGSTFVISSFRTIPYALLQRELRFRSLALLEAAQALVLASFTVTLAWLGFGYWTLVASAVASSLCSAVLVLSLYPCGFSRPRLASLREAMGFSGHIIVSRLAWYAYSNADFYTVGRMLGQSALGAYGFAWMLASIAVEKITVLIMQVTPAVFSAVQSDKAALRRYLLTITEGLAVATFPATVGLALVADDFVRLALGEQWLGAVVPLRILALYASVRSLTPILPQVLAVVGETRFIMWNNIAAAVVLPIGFVVGSRWGTAGVAIAWIVLYPCIVLFLFRRVFRAIDLTAAAYARALYPALSSTAAMVAAVLAITAILPAGTPLTATLALKIAAGGGGYLGLLLLVHRERVRALRATLAAG